MPEGPEVYMNGQLLNAVCKDKVFGGKIVKSAVSKLCQITFDSPKYTLSSETKGKELALTIQCEQNKDKNLRVLFNFGMSGHFRFAPVDEEIKHAHLSFFTEDAPKMALHFVDVRRFGSWKPCDTWGTDRGPDPMFESEEFRDNVLENLSTKVFNKPICEVMLEQKYFNGVGNYLRSEILFRAKIAPFTCARTILAEIKDGNAKSPDFLEYCHDVPNEVIKLGTGKNYDLTSSSDDHEEFDKWLQCYNQPDMDNLPDHNKRTVWFKGDPGEMAPVGAVGKKKSTAAKKPQKEAGSKKTAAAKKPIKEAASKKPAKKEAKSEDSAVDEEDEMLDDAATVQATRVTRKRKETTSIEEPKPKRKKKK